jgi:hypothetical protein
MGFAQGGGVPGPTDTVPAMMTPGEGVLTTGSMGMPGVGKMMTLLNAISDLDAGPQMQGGMGGNMQMDGMEGEAPGMDSEICPECGQSDHDPQGYSFGGWIKDNAHWAIPAAMTIAAAAFPPAAPLAAAAAEGGTAAAAAPTAGAMGAFKAGVAKSAASQGVDYLAGKLNPPPVDNSQYMQPYPQQPRGYAGGGEVGGMCSMCGRPKVPGYAAGGSVLFGTLPKQPANPRGSSPIGFPAAHPVVRPPQGETPGLWNTPAPENPDLAGARGAGYFDPRGNQMLINSMREGAQGTADALVRRQMTQADFGGMDPAQRAVAKLQALRETGRGVQDIMAQTRAGALESQNAFYQNQYGAQQKAEQDRQAALRAQWMASEQIRQTGIENRRTKGAKGK